MQLPHGRRVLRMRLLDRYLLRELLVPLAYCLCGFMIFWIASEMFSDLHTLQEKHLRGLDIAAYYFFRIPQFLPVALPVALLMALLYTLTNHARYNEITAIRAAGVSLVRLCFPYFLVGLLCSGLLFAINEFLAPQTEDIADNVLSSRTETTSEKEDDALVKNLFFANSRVGRQWRVGTYNQDTGEMRQVMVVWRLPDGLQRSLYANRAARTNGVWTFYQVREIQQAPGSNSLPVQLPPVAELPMPSFNETRAEIRSDISISDRYGRQLGRQNKTRRADIPMSDIFNYLRLHPHLDRGVSAWIHTKLQGRFAGPCTCLVVVLIAIPFGAASGRRNVFVGVATSITIFFIYFILQQVGFAFGEVGRVPAWLGAWLPNILFGLTGLVLIARVR